METHAFTITALFARGLLGTLQLWIGSALLGFTTGTCLGIAHCKQFRNSLFKDTILRSYVFITRGIPLYVHVLLAFFVLPDLIGVDIAAQYAAICALGFCSSGYITELIRSGIDAIPQGQWEAAYTLGYTQMQTVRYIIMPQMVRSMFPALVNELESILKSTSVLSTIGVMELTKVGNNLVARYMTPVPILFTIALLYLVLSACLKLLVHIFQKRLWADA